MAVEQLEKREHEEETRHEVPHPAHPVEAVGGKLHQQRHAEDIAEDQQNRLVGFQERLLFLHLDPCERRLRRMDVCFRRSFADLILGVVFQRRLQFAQADVPLHVEDGSWVTRAAVMPGTFSRAFLTVAPPPPQVIPVTENSCVIIGDFFRAKFWAAVTTSVTEFWKRGIKF